MLRSSLNSLPRRTSFPCARSAAVARHSSSSPSSTPPSSLYLPSTSQIRVIPFAIPPEEATARLNTWALPVTKSFEVFVYALGEKLLPSVFQSKVKMTELKMVYLPAWSWSAEVGARLETATVSHEEDAEGEEGKDEVATTSKKAGSTFGTEVSAEGSRAFFPGASLPGGLECLG